MEVTICRPDVKLGLPRRLHASHISPMTISPEGWRKHALLTPAQMGEADRLTIAGGVSGIELMETAGRKVADAVSRRWPPQPVAVLCGPGNNGGDGFVAARVLAERGWPVRLALLGSVPALHGDAAQAAARWPGAVEALVPAAIEGAAVVVDGIFGAGLARPVEDVARAVIEAIGERRLPVVAIDVPSGIDGASGEVRGIAPRAAVTVTFFRKKPGHLLLPGRSYCGETVLEQIGIPDSVLDRIAPDTVENAPDWWLGAFPRPSLESHKYARGHALVAGGAVMTGAARLAARAAARLGAGLVTVAASEAAFPIYAAALTGVIVHPVVDLEAFQALLADDRRNAALIGPGAGVGGETRDRTLAILGAGKRAVLDADALTSFAEDPDTLFSAIRSPCVMTPHAGEFSRLFDTAGDKAERTRRAARQSGAVMLLKGADTVIAAPEGRVAINANAPPQLATGGSGDVLAGIVLGLLAQGMEPFAAAAFAAWIHGAAACRFGHGLVAEDLIDAVAPVLQELLSRATRRLPEHVS
ncbi:MAG TPA: NAD(P)H-hydrate dehydratase [Stellaceae bacterium]|nr:NAD(P)H-hydrate dehydratase [Stellaceae bacterium]